MTGMVQGGWEYVIAAYVVTAVVFGIFVLTTELALRKEGR
jgi:hypothetical protein